MSILLKKLIALGGAGAALLAFAIPSLACVGTLCISSTSENYATVNVTTIASSNTGGNMQANQTTVKKASEIIALSATGMGSQSITTGNAYSRASSLAVVNASPCGCTDSDCLISSTKNGVTTGVTTQAVSDAGTNQQVNLVDVSQAHEVAAGSLNLGGSSTIHTGASTSVVRSRTLVNVRPIVWN